MRINHLNSYSALAHRVETSNSIVNAGDVLREILRDLAAAIRDASAQIGIRSARRGARFHFTLPLA